jgi:hypothetical protein
MPEQDPTDEKAVEMPANKFAAGESYLMEMEETESWMRIDDPVEVCPSHNFARLTANFHRFRSHGERSR